MSKKRSTANDSEPQPLKAIMNAWELLGEGKIRKAGGMELRKITEDDIPLMVHKGQLLMRESSFREYDYDMRKIYSLCHEIIEDDDEEWFFRVVEDNYEFCGFFIGYISETYFGRDKMASDYLLYVDPERRKGRTALMLISAFEEWAEDKGARFIQLGVTTGIDEELTCRFYGKMGFKHKGTIMQKEV